MFSQARSDEQYEIQSNQLHVVNFAGPNRTWFDRATGYSTSICLVEQEDSELIRFNVSRLTGWLLSVLADRG